MQQDSIQQQQLQELNQTWNSDDAFRQALRNFAKSGHADPGTTSLLGFLESQYETPATKEGS